MLRRGPEGHLAFKEQEQPSAWAVPVRTPFGPQASFPCPLTLHELVDLSLFCPPDHHTKGVKERGCAWVPLSVWLLDILLSSALGQSNLPSWGMGNSHVQRKPPEYKKQGVGEDSMSIPDCVFLVFCLSILGRHSFPLLVSYSCSQVKPKSRGPESPFRMLLGQSCKCLGVFWCALGEWEWGELHQLDSVYEHFRWTLSWRHSALSTESLSNCS